MIEFSIYAPVADAVTFRRGPFFFSLYSPPAPSAGEADEAPDSLEAELKVWADIAPGGEICSKFTAPDGLLNEFAMMWALRERFPLHFTVFKQAASHLPHEANIEQFFSRAGNLSDPNQKPSHLAALVSAGANRGAFCPWSAPPHPHSLS